MEKEKSILDVIHEESSITQSLASKIDYLSDLFFAVGNEKIARQLDEIGQRLRQSSERLHDLGGTYTDEIIRNANQNSTNILKSCFAMVEVSRVQKGGEPDPVIQKFILGESEEPGFMEDFQKQDRTRRSEWGTNENQ